MNRAEMKKVIEQVADNLYSRGYAIAINYSLPFIAITLMVKENRGRFSQKGPLTFWSAQGDEASEWLSNAYSATKKFKVSDEDWMMFSLESAGIFDE